jgi:hypothetical protein
MCASAPGLRVREREGMARNRDLSPKWLSIKFNYNKKPFPTLNFKGRGQSRIRWERRSWQKMAIICALLRDASCYSKGSKNMPQFGKLVNCSSGLPWPRALPLHST